MITALIALGILALIVLALMFLIDIGDYGDGPTDGLW